MKVEERISAFHELGEFLKELPEDEFQTLTLDTKNENPWFTEENLRMSFKGLIKLLDKKELTQWVNKYSFDILSKKIAIVMAGNVPMVGFHDLLCVLICGHTVLIKASSKDSVLIKFLVNKLSQLEPRFKDKIEFGEQLKGFDAIIATGSDNASRYFEYYFSKYPHIIRKNRTSIAILNGTESEAELRELGTDVFSYFGLGCRNVSKLFLPEGFRIENVIKTWEPFHDIIHHHKYCNNYDYQKSILLVTQTPFLDNGFVMFQEHTNLVSPIAVVYYEYYKDRTSLDDKLDLVKEKIQCIVEQHPGPNIKFGQAQFPSLGDYADQIDTMRFLTNLD